MILGKITGKTSTSSFKFKVEHEAKKFEYVQVMHQNNGFFLAQIVEIEKTSSETTATCMIIGKRENNILKGLRVPPDPGLEVLRAEDDFVRKILGLEKKENSAYFGTLEGRDNLKVYLDLNRLITKHLAVLAKTGAGKSYCLATILEELLEYGLPIVIIDPHGEYNTLKYPNTKDTEKLNKFGLNPKGYLTQIQEFSPDTETNPEARPLKLSNNNLSTSELIHMLPAKLSNSQIGLLYSALKNLDRNADLNDLIVELEMEDNNSKWTVINILEYMKKLNLFSNAPTTMGELVQPGKCSIINLKGVPPEVQEVVVYKLLNDLFAERKKGNIPPFFLIVEEAQNYCPERSFGEAKSSPILRQIASEGRKFGLGLAIVSQRPARVDKNILSQCGTQIILKVTNPHDLKAISNSVEGITHETEKEIQNIPIGTALVTGIVDMPLFVNVKPRRSKHGGDAVNIFSSIKTEEPEVQEESIIKQAQEFKNVQGELLPIINQKLSLEDVKLMNDGKEVKQILIPCAMLRCNQGGDDFQLLIDLNKAEIVTDIETATGKSLLNLNLKEISGQQSKILKIAMKLKNFKAAELFAKSGVQFSELYDIIQILTKKGYLIRDGDTFMLSDELDDFANLEKLANYEKIDYQRIQYNKKLDKKYDIDKIKEFLSKFAAIKDLKECWLIKYAIDSSL